MNEDFEKELRAGMREEATTKEVLQQVLRDIDTCAKATQQTEKRVKESNSRTSFELSELNSSIKRLIAKAPVQVKHSTISTKAVWYLIIALFSFITVIYCVNLSSTALTQWDARSAGKAAAEKEYKVSLQVERDAGFKEGMIFARDELKDNGYTKSSGWLERNHNKYYGHNFFGP